MIKILRKFAAKLSGPITNRFGSGRRELEVPIRISFAPENNTGRLDVKREVLSIRGKTKDLSATGVAFMVDSIRLREHYLVGENRVLDAELTLPQGKIMMKLIGQRYEQFGKHLSINTYLIGATIQSITPNDEQVYQRYLRGDRTVSEGMESILGFDSTNQ